MPRVGYSPQSPPAGPIPHSARKLQCPKHGQSPITLPGRLVLRHKSIFVTMEKVPFHSCVFSSSSPVPIVHPLHAVSRFHNPIPGDIFVHNLTQDALPSDPHEDNKMQIWLWSGEEGWIRAQKGSRHPDRATFPQLKLKVPINKGRLEPKWEVIRGPREKFKWGRANRALDHAPQPINVGRPQPTDEDEEIACDSEPEREALRNWPNPEPRQSAWKPRLFWADLIEAETKAREKAYEIDERW